MKPGLERIQAIAERWFLTEPLLFSMYCTHTLERDDTLSVPFRTGHMRIAFCEKEIARLSDRQLEHYLTAEVLRIVLKHPYERVPPQPNTVALGFASDVTIMQAAPLSIPLQTCGQLGLQKGLSYEEYYRDLAHRPIAQRDYGESEQGDGDGDDRGTARDAAGNEERSDHGTSRGADDNSAKEPSEQQKAAQRAALWQEDEFATEEINARIKKAQATNGWGSISGDLQELIEASLVIRMDYRRILSSFRASVLSQHRERTRTRPNRRYGFAYMGSRYAFTTRLLVAVDVSGSVTSESLAQFFSVINRFFKYGIQAVDVIQFDCEITGTVLSLKKARRSVKITGRGGTHFQPPVDYYSAHSEYDGLIICTDGYADAPTVATARNTLWMLTDKAAYEQAATWIQKLPRNRAVWIPQQ